MEQLKVLRQKNDLLVKLYAAQPAAPEAERKTFVDALLAMSRVFGPDTFHHLKICKELLPSLDDHLLRALCDVVQGQPQAQAEATAQTAATAAPDARHGVASCSSCCATIEGVDLAQSALEDFINSYYMFHNLNSDSTHDVLKYSPFLGFIESHIYDLDQANEDRLHPEMAFEMAPNGAIRHEDDPFGPLRQVLQERTWMTPELDSEFQQGAHFWALERQICRSLGSKSVSFTQEEAEEALRLKSFDYRAMNLLLYQMRGEKPCKEHMDFLATSEILVEIGDDLVDYYEDMERNSFNIYRCFVALHGDSAQTELRRYISAAEEAYAAAFSALQELDEPLAAKWLQRNQASKRHNCGSEKPGGATWEIPPAVQEMR